MKHLHKSLAQFDNHDELLPCFVVCSIARWTELLFATDLIFLKKHWNESIFLSHLNATCGKFMETLCDKSYEVVENGVYNQCMSLRFILALNAMMFQAGHRPIFPICYSKEVLYVDNATDFFS